MCEFWYCCPDVKSTFYSGVASNVDMEDEESRNLMDAGQEILRPPTLRMGQKPGGELTSDAPDTTNPSEFDID